MRLLALAFVVFVIVFLLFGNVFGFTKPEPVFPKVGSTSATTHDMVFLNVFNHPVKDGEMVQPYKCMFSQFDTLKSSKNDNGDNHEKVVTGLDVTYWLYIEISSSDNIDCRSGWVRYEEVENYFK